jgi:hypothetical protein
MYIDKIREAFERANLGPNSQITRQNLYDFLTRLTVPSYLFSLANPMTWKWLINYGSRHQEVMTLLMLTAFVKLSMMVSTFSKSNLMRSTVLLPT